MPCQCTTNRQKAKCVYWIGPEQGILETNERGEQRIATGCLPTLLIRYMGFIAKTNLGAASAIEDNRNRIYDGLQSLIPLISSAQERVPSDETPNTDRSRLLDHSNGDGC